MTVHDNRSCVTELWGAHWITLTQCLAGYSYIINQNLLHFVEKRKKKKFFRP